MKTVLVVFGMRLTPSGEMCAEFRARCALAAQYLQDVRGADTTIVISGGRTRRAFDTEAHMGERCIAEMLPADNSACILLEAQSYNTPENVRNVLQMLQGCEVEQVVLIGGFMQLVRVRVLLWRLRAELRTIGLHDRLPVCEYVPTLQSGGLWRVPVQLLFLPFDVLFPRGTGWPHRLLARVRHAPRGRRI